MVTWIMEDGATSFCRESMQAYLADSYFGRPAQEASSGTFRRNEKTRDRTER